MSNEINTIFKMQLNHLAALFYQSNGREYQSDLDFSKSQHGEERGCWNKAIIAYAVINGDDDLLKHQV